MSPSRIVAASEAPTAMPLKRASLTPRTPGVVKPPARFWMVANWKWFVIEYAASTYVRAPSVDLTTPATPELPRALVPVGKFTVVLKPTLLFHCELTADR